MDALNYNVCIIRILVAGNIIALEKQATMKYLTEGATLSSDGELRVRLRDPCKT